MPASPNFLGLVPEPFHPGAPLELDIPANHRWMRWIEERHAAAQKLPPEKRLLRRHAELAVSLGGIVQFYDMIGADARHDYRSQISFRTEWRMTQ